MNHRPRATAKDLLTAISDLQRRGPRRILEDLERIEPEVAEYFLEQLTEIHHQVMTACLSSRDVRRISRRVESLVLVALLTRSATTAAPERDAVRRSPPRTQVKPARRPSN